MQQRRGTRRELKLDGVITAPAAPAPPFCCSSSAGAAIAERTRSASPPPTLGGRDRELYPTARREPNIFRQWWSWSRTPEARAMFQANVVICVITLMGLILAIAAPSTSVQHAQFTNVVLAGGFKSYNFDTNIRYAEILLFGVNFIYLFYATVVFRSYYEGQLQQGCNTLRWIHYAALSIVFLMATMLDEQPLDLMSAIFIFMMYVVSATVFWQAEQDVSLNRPQAVTSPTHSAAVSNTNRSVYRIHDGESDEHDEEVMIEDDPVDSRVVVMPQRTGIRKVGVLVAMAILCSFLPLFLQFLALIVNNAQPVPWLLLSMPMIHILSTCIATIFRHTCMLSVYAIEAYYVFGSVVCVFVFAGVRAYNPINVHV